LAGQVIATRRAGRQDARRDVSAGKPASVSIASFVESRSARIAAIDVVRGAAIIAMVVYHAAFDLTVRRWVPFNAATDLGWVILARATAGTFLMLVGVSLVLATRNGLKPGPFLRRLALIIVAAILVTIATWYDNPDTLVFFGILHHIALASVLALPFLRLPSWLTALAAIAMFAVFFLYRSPVFDWPPLWWVGLGEQEPVTVDYVPLFPWFGVVLAGIVVGREIVVPLLGTPLARWQPQDWLGRTLVGAGRWSLLIYLIHQPLLYAVFWAASPFVSPNEAGLRADFSRQCVTACAAQGRDDATCQAFCGCVFTNLTGTDLMRAASIAVMNDEQRARWNAIIGACRPPAGE
jgi:uncharacterized membrane protein